MALEETSFKFYYRKFLNFSELTEKLKNLKLTNIPQFFLIPKEFIVLFMDRW